MNDTRCRLCHQDALLPALHLRGAPRNIQRLYTAEQLVRDSAVDLTFLQCARCGFVQLPPLLEEAYYDDYLMLATHSPQMQSFQRRQAADFVERFGLRGRSVREMGCGDGSFLDHLRAAGAVVSGIEPSQPTRERAIARGHRVESGYVSAGRDLDGGPFDAFVTRQVLEHVPDIHDFLAGIRRNVKPGAPGLVEVPSLEKAIEDRRYYDFFADHVNYFSRRTLGLALEMNGFEVLDVFPDMFDEYNVALVRALPAPRLDEIQQTVETLGRELHALIARHHAAGRKVAIWGAGGKGLSVLAAAGIRSVDLLVDADPSKQGLYTPVSHLLVQPPAAITGSGVAAVIITAMAYRHEIEKTLATELGFRGEIAVLGHHLDLVGGR